MQRDEIRGQMEIDEFTDRFFQMEMEDDLFFRFAQVGEPLWDLVRFEVFLSLFDHVCGKRPSVEPQGRTPRRRSSGKIRSDLGKLNSATTNWLRLKRVENADFIALACSRYTDPLGMPVDFANQDALQVLASHGSVQLVETQPWVERGINITAATALLARFIRLSATQRDHILVLTSTVAASQKARFGELDPSLFRVINHAYRRFAVLRRTWSAILDRSRPRGVLMTQNGIQKGLLYEARRRRIPVIECQHGVVNLMHPAYSYPPLLPPGDHVALPDLFLLFADYWKKQCCMPGTCAVPVGNSKFCSNGVKSSREGPAIFISAGPFHSYIGPLAAEIARRMPDRSFVLKLHPAQGAERRGIEEDYRMIPNLSVIGIERSMPDLLSDASDVVLIQSTASYEALDRGIPVHILKRPGHRSHSDLFSRPDVHLAANAQELQAALFRPSPSVEHLSRYFQPFSAELFNVCLAEVGVWNPPSALR